MRNIKETIYRIKKSIAKGKTNKQNTEQTQREQFIAKQRKRIMNKNVSIISSNCNGAFILHDLGLPFNSPFVNLWIRPQDFIKLLLNLDTYMKSDIKEIFEDGICYPIGQLRDINLYFQHYSSFEEAKKKWIERKKRINKNNLYILFTDRDGCSYQDLLEFDQLTYKNKVVFTNHEYHEISSSFYIKGFENEKSWFNNGKIKRIS